MGGQFCIVEDLENNQKNSFISNSNLQILQENLEMIYPTDFLDGIRDSNNFIAITDFLESNREDLNDVLDILTVRAPQHLPLNIPAGPPDAEYNKVDLIEDKLMAFTRRIIAVLVPGREETNVESMKQNFISSILPLISNEASSFDKDFYSSLIDTIKGAPRTLSSSYSGEEVNQKEESLKLLEEDKPPSNIRMLAEKYNSLIFDDWDPEIIEI